MQSVLRKWLGNAWLNWIARGWNLHGFANVLGSLRNEKSCWTFSSRFVVEGLKVEGKMDDKERTDRHLVVRIKCFYWSIESVWVMRCAYLHNWALLNSDLPSSRWPSYLHDGTIYAPRLIWTSCNWHRTNWGLGSRPQVNKNGKSDDSLESAFIIVLSPYKGFYYRC